MEFNRLASTGPGWLDFARGSGPLILGASIALHIVLLALLPSLNRCLSASQPPELLVKLQAAVPVARIKAAAQPIAAPTPAYPAYPAPSHAIAPPLSSKQMKPSRQQMPAQSGAPATSDTLQPGTVATVTGGGGPAVASGNGVGSGEGSGSGPATAMPAAEGLPGGTGTGTSHSGIPAAPAPKPATMPQSQPKPAPAIDVKSLLASYAGGVKAAILRHKAYPATAERLGHEGAAKVSFTIDIDGSLQSATIRSSSGYDELDEAALDAVRSAAPFDSIPAEARKDQLSMSITLKFSLGG